MEESNKSGLSGTIAHIHNSSRRGRVNSLSQEKKLSRLAFVQHSPKRPSNAKCLVVLERLFDRNRAFVADEVGVERLRNGESKVQFTSLNSEQRRARR